jgi:hypothetical protein
VRAASTEQIGNAFASSQKPIRENDLLNVAGSAQCAKDPLDLLDDLVGVQHAAANETERRLPLGQKW